MAIKDTSKNRSHEQNVSKDSAEQAAEAVTPSSESYVPPPVTPVGNFHQHYMPTRIYVGNHCSTQIGHYLGKGVARVLIVTLQNEVKQIDSLNRLKSELEKHVEGVIVHDDYYGFPVPEKLDKLAYLIRESKTNLVLAYGGRETLQTVRVAALLASNYIFAREMTEERIENAHAPVDFATVPIGPIFGEELLPVYTISLLEEETILYMHDNKLFPKICFSDPALCANLSHNELLYATFATLSMTLDACSTRHSSIINVPLATYVIEVIIRNLSRLLKNKDDKGLYENLSLGSMYSGMLCANTGMGLAYGLAISLRDVLQSDFCAVLNVMIPHVLEFNLINKSEDYIIILRNISEDFKNMTVVESVIKFIEIFRRLALDFHLPQRLSEFNIAKENLTKVANYAQKLSVIRNSARPVEDGDLLSLLETAY